MICLLNWNEIELIWQTQLWPNRLTPIKTHSAMMFLHGYNMKNFSYNSNFFGYKINEKIVGVNSGHKCADESFRSRGLWVDPLYRKQGIGRLLLEKTISQACVDGATFIWSYPRFSSWKTYQSVGFELQSDWAKSETSESNGYCLLLLKK